MRERVPGHELGRLKTLFRAFRDVAWEHDEARNDYHRLAAEAREHLAIVEALLAGDRQAAVAAMARHIRCRRRVLVPGACPTARARTVRTRRPFPSQTESMK